jgi:hypothetical protein
MRCDNGNVKFALLHDGGILSGPFFRSSEESTLSSEDENQPAATPR